MFRSIMLAGVLALSAAGAASAQTVTPAPTGQAAIPPEAAAIGEKFFRLLQDQKFGPAFHFAFKDVEPIMGSANIDAAGVQFQDFTKTLGSLQRWSPLWVRVYNADFIEVTYIAEFENLPLFFTLQYYNSGKGWRIADTKFNSYDKAMADGFIPRR